MHSLSSGVSRIASPMKKPLLRILWCDRVAPLGKPVVPEVNWMLIGSSNCSFGASAPIHSASAARPRANLGEAEGSRMPTVAQEDDRAKRRQPRRLQPARLRLAEFRRQFAENADIV